MDAPGEYCIAPGERLPLAAGCISRLCLPGRTPIGKVLLACPICRGSKTRRSKRRTAVDYLFGFVGVLPWRCGACEVRDLRQFGIAANFRGARAGDEFHSLAGAADSSVAM